MRLICTGGVIFTQHHPHHLPTPPVSQALSADNHQPTARRQGAHADTTPRRTTADRPRGDREDGFRIEHGERRSRTARAGFTVPTSDASRPLSFVFSVHAAPSSLDAGRVRPSSFDLHPPYLRSAPICVNPTSAAKAPTLDSLAYKGHDIKKPTQKRSSRMALVSVRLGQLQRLLATVRYESTASAARRSSVRTVLVVRLVALFVVQQEV